MTPSPPVRRRGKRRSDLPDIGSYEFRSPPTTAEGQQTQQEELSDNDGDETRTVLQHHLSLHQLVGAQVSRRQFKFQQGFHAQRHDTAANVKTFASTVEASKSVLNQLKEAELEEGDPNNNGPCNESTAVAAGVTTQASMCVS